MMSSKPVKETQKIYRPWYFGFNHKFRSDLLYGVLVFVFESESLISDMSGTPWR